MTESVVSGGDEPEAGEQVRAQFARIRSRRKRRAVAWGIIVGLIGFLFVQALNATGLLQRQDFNWSFFWASVRSYVPITRSDGIPLVDASRYVDWGTIEARLPVSLPAGVPHIDAWQYLEFIQRRDLLFDHEIASLLLDWPPQLYTFFVTELGVFMIFGEAGITLAMGVAGTILGFPLALLFGVLGSERVTPFPLNFLFRGTMSFIRAIPALVWVLVFIPLAGLGAAAATIAIAVDTIGNLGRLFVDELEEIEDGPIEAMQTTGANRPQLIVFGMLSQVRSAFIAWTLYILEINVRIAVTVGVYGAGGLGHIVEVERGLRQYTNMMAGLLCIFLLIISVELFSQRLRARLRSDEEHMGLRELLLGFPDRFASSMLR